MQKYEYLCISIFGGAKKTTRVLNEYAARGWELVDTHALWFYFKRAL